MENKNIETLTKDQNQSESVSGSLNTACPWQNIIGKKVLSFSTAGFS